MSDLDYHIWANETLVRIAIGVKCDGRGEKLNYLERLNLSGDILIFAQIISRKRPYPLLALFELRGRNHLFMGVSQNVNHRLIKYSAHLEQMSGRYSYLFYGDYEFSGNGNIVASRITKKAI